MDSVTGELLAAEATGTAQTTGYMEPLMLMMPPMDTIMYGGCPAPTGPCNMPNTVMLRAKLQPTP